MFSVTWYCAVKSKYKYVNERTESHVYVCLFSHMWY